MFRAALLWLSISSLFFYAWWNPKYLPLLAGSILFNFFLGKLLAKHHLRYIFLVLGISTNLCIIALYKYLGFFASIASSITGATLDLPAIILPLAISFFTFQQIAYLVDTFRTGSAEKRFDRYLLFVTFFPQLIAGPIVKHSDVASQFELLESRRIPLNQISAGLLLFSIGLAKKVLIADQLAPYATPVFASADQGSEITLLESWGGLLAYTFQLYFDFSGYADMALGIAKMFGINLPKNFNSPYQATSIIEFWRRWHITLSNFLRDYLYIPLGGNRKGSRSANLVTTMLLGGLWHGAGWNFIIWGGLHGLFLMINHQWILIRNAISSRGYAEGYQLHTTAGVAVSSDSINAGNDTERSATRRPSRIWIKFSCLPGMVITFLAVCSAWAFFRAETLQGALSILQGFYGFNGILLPEKITHIAPVLFSDFTESNRGDALGVFPHLKGFLLIAIAMAIAFLTPNSNQICSRCFPTEESGTVIERRSILAYAWMICAGIAITLCLKTLAFTQSSEFLYFNF
ncbi:MBOAT family O-acyltransferase [Microbulbifer agarilyticus]|nr:MBOAT family O-acyltransferase [Microbulbifer agarilyticus]